MTARLLDSVTVDTMEALANELSTPPALPCPAPGVYPGTHIETYHRWPCASNSRLSKLLRSPAHLKAYLDEPQDDTAALIMGRAAHSAILEPELFAKLYGRSSGADRRTKAGKQEWDDLLAQFGEGYVLKPDDHDAARKMRDAVYAHASASKLLAGDGDVEFSVVWDAHCYGDEKDELVRCKARLDKFSPAIAGGVIVDVKTTKDASPREFERSIFTYGYHRQAALYLDAAHTAGIDAEHFVIIAVEKESPWAVGVYRLTDGAIEAGREQVMKLLKTYAMCEALGSWPAYGDDVKDIAIPTWAWSQLDAPSPFNSEAA
jgi:hypothetical protein